MELISLRDIRKLDSHSVARQNADFLLGFNETRRQNARTIEKRERGTEIETEREREKECEDERREEKRRRRRRRRKKRGKEAIGPCIRRNRDNAPMIFTQLNAVLILRRIIEHPEVCLLSLLFTGFPLLSRLPWLRQTFLRDRKRRKRRKRET